MQSDSKKDSSMKKDKNYFSMILKVICFVVIIYFITTYIISPIYIKQTAPMYIKNFTKEDALEDYDYIWRVLEDNYPYFGVVERKLDINPMEEKTKWREKIENKDEIDFDTFYSIICDCFSRFQGIGHLNLFSPDLYISLMDSLDVPNIDKGYLQEMKRITRDIDRKKSDTTYKYLGTPSLIQAMNTKLSYNPIKNLELQKLTVDTAYIKIHTLLKREQKIFLILG